MARRAPAPTEPLLPPVAFDGLEVHDGALVLTARQGLSACVAIVARLDATGFDRLLLDLRGVDRLSAEELGLLADLRLLAEARSLTSGLFGVSAALRPLLVRAGGRPSRGC